MPESEQALLARYAERGDADAFRALVERHEDMVFAACNRILRNAADAEDAAQDCFLQLTRKAAQLRAPIAGWLHRVAVRMSLKLLRRDSRPPRRPPRPHRPPLPPAPQAARHRRGTGHHAVGRVQAIGARRGGIARALEEGRPHCFGRSAEHAALGQCG